MVVSFQSSNNNKAYLSHEELNFLENLLKIFVFAGKLRSLKSEVFRAELDFVEKFED